MTQQQLADELGVSLRTVGSWERGETIPRNRLAALAETLNLEGASEFGTDALLRRIGYLAKRRREEIGLGRIPFAKEAGMGSDKTVKEFEFGRALPGGTSQRRIEKALGWRYGAIADVMTMVNRKADSITMESVDAEDSLYLDAQSPKTLALYSDDELLDELRRRLKTDRRLAAQHESADTEAQNLYGLAASTNSEHLEDEEK